jgi:hypothetical protein
MTLKTANSESIKVTITLPRLVLERMNELVPARQRSRFISEALAERLALTEQQLALEESAGAWSNERHPEMQDDAAIDRWLIELRQSWTTSGAVEHGDLPA